MLKLVKFNCMRNTEKQEKDNKLRERKKRAWC